MRNLLIGAIMMSVFSPIMAWYTNTYTYPLQPVSAPVSAPGPKPIFEWQRIADRNFELQALGLQRFDLPSRAKLRIRVDAGMGIFGGVFASSDFDKAMSKGVTFRYADFVMSRCSLAATNKAETTCDVDSDSKLVYIIRDKRSEAALADDVISANPDLAPMEGATTGNPVEVSIDEWTCTSNCTFQK